MTGDPTTLLLQTAPSLVVMGDTDLNGSSSRKSSFASSPRVAPAPLQSSVVKRPRAVTIQTVSVIKPAKQRRNIRRAWFEEASLEEQAMVRENEVDWFHKRLFRVPAMRYAWGDEQPGLHPGSNEIILDLSELHSHHLSGCTWAAVLPPPSPAACPMPVEDSEPHVV